MTRHPTVARALTYTAPREAELRETALPEMAEGRVRLRTLWSALSRGTERIVFEGRVPESEFARMRAPFQEGDFPFPVVYGYSAVSLVEEGPGDLAGAHVFSLSPHQDRACLPAEAVTPLPDGLPPERAVLAANAETALNAIWDAPPRPGSRVAVVGAGPLGCLVAGLLSARGDLSVHVIDLAPERGAALAGFPVTFIPAAEVAVENPFDAMEPVETVFHTSATAAGLQTALGILDFEGRVVELSWFGAAPVPLALGGAFHSRRLTIQSSQVGHVAAPRRASTSRRDRLAAALACLRDPRFDAFVSEDVAFADLPSALPRLLDARAGGIATRIRY